MTASKQLKIFVAPQDHDRVRLAAALRRTSMADFCRQTILSEAGRLTQGLRLEPEDVAKADPTIKSIRRRSNSL